MHNSEFFRVLRGRASSKAGDSAQKKTFCDWPGPPRLTLLSGHTPVRAKSSGMVQVHCDFGIIVIQFGAEISKVTRKKKKKKLKKTQKGPRNALFGSNEVSK